MSKVKVNQPTIEHTPSFKTLEIDGTHMLRAIAELKEQIGGIVLPVGMLDSLYYYTDLEGWGKILWDMTFNSNLYKVDIFDCEDYAFKAMLIARERYGLNTLGVVFGKIPAGRHGFNIFYHGDGFKLHEPNQGGNGGIMDLGDNGYVTELIII